LPAFKERHLYYNGRLLLNMWLSARIADKMINTLANKAKVVVIYRK